MKSVDVMRCCLVRDKSVKYTTTSLESPDDVKAFFGEMGLEDLAEEVFAMVCVDAKAHVVGYHEISHGDTSSTIVHPREVYKRALLNNAYAIVACHNHPSGDSTPSEEDIEMTRRLNEAGELMGVKLFDHIIIGNGETFSFKEEMPEYVW